MILFPNAKINLGLNIVAKRADGYHDIETLFYPIDLEDALEVVPSDTEADSLHISGIQVDGDPNNNLVMKALRLIRSIHPVPPVSVYLHKAIPFGAGLGGGSADAATMILLLNQLFDLQMNEQEMLKISAQIGADCPFFIKNKPVFATGTGNEFTETALSLSGKFLVLIKPDIHVSTPLAYSRVIPQKPAKSLTEICKQPIETWQKEMINDFESTVFPLFPEIKKIKESLINSGATYAAMSGSGSSVFGIFDDEPKSLPAYNEYYIWKGLLR